LSLTIFCSNTDIFFKVTQIEIGICLITKDSKLLFSIKKDYIFLKKVKYIHRILFYHLKEANDVVFIINSRSSLGLFVIFGSYFLIPKFFYSK